MSTEREVSERLVVETARRCLAERNLDILLLFILKKDEAELRREFEETLRVRKLGEGARETYDFWFCECALRLQREAAAAVHRDRNYVQSPLTL